MLGYLGTTPFPPVRNEKSLIVPFYYIAVADETLEAAFALRPLPASGGKLPGLVLEPQIPSQFPLTLRLADTITLRLVAGTNAASQVGHPDPPRRDRREIPLRARVRPPPSAGIGVGFDFKPAEPKVLLGSRDATRLEFQGASLDLAARSVNGVFEAVVGGELAGLALVLAAGEGDSFLKIAAGRRADPHRRAARGRVVEPFRRALQGQRGVRGRRPPAPGDRPGLDRRNHRAPRRPAAEPARRRGRARGRDHRGHRADRVLPPGRRAEGRADVLQRQPRAARRPARLQAAQRRRPRDRRRRLQGRRVPRLRQREGRVRRRARARVPGLRRPSRRSASSTPGCPTGAPASPCSSSSPRSSRRSSSASASR